MAKVSLKIMDKKKVTVSKIVDSVTSINDKGIFDVLELHSNYISIIQNRIIYRIGEQSIQVPIQNAVMWVRNNSVTIFL